MRPTQRRDHYPGRRRPLAAGAARQTPRAVAETLRARKRKFEQTGISDLLGDMTPMEFFLRFTIGHPDMHTTIIGTTDTEHLAANIAAASRVPCHRMSARPRRRGTPSEWLGCLH